MTTPPIGGQSPQDEWLQHPSIGIPREHFTRVAQQSPGGPGQQSPGGPIAPQQDAAPGRTPIAAPKKSIPLTIITASGSTQLLAGSQERFKVTVKPLNGPEKDVTGEVTWAPAAGISISDMGYAEIKAAAGTVTLTATHAATGATGSITLTVVTRILKKIVISPKNPLFEVGRNEPLRADGEFSDHTVENITARVTWESRDEKVAKVNWLGLCDNKAPGTADIWASDPDNPLAIGITKLTVHARGRPPTLVRIEITPLDPTITNPEPVQFTAMGEYLADNTPHDVTNRVRWVSNKPNTLAIDERTGEAIPGIVSDIARVTADAPGAYGVSEVTVNVPKLVDIKIDPRDPSVPKVVLSTPHSGAGLVSLTVEGTFSDGKTKPVTSKVTWSSDKPDVADVSANILSGFDEGKTAVISAAVPNSPGVGDSIIVTVVPAIVGAIEIDPGSASPGGITMSVGGKQKFTATAIYTDGRREELKGRNVRWESVFTTPSIITITQKGEATALVAGTATIGATKPGTNRRESVFVTVVP